MLPGAAAGPRVIAVTVVAIAAAASVTASRHAQPPQPPDVRLQYSQDADRHRVRAVAAFDESVARYREWLGPIPRLAGEPAAVVAPAPWRSDAATMDVESAVAYDVARRWWPGVGADSDAAPLLEGVAWYLQSRVVEALFDRTFFVEGHHADHVHFFGGTWPWAFRGLPLSRWTGGLDRIGYLQAQPGGTRARGGLAFGTLERVLTWPVLQGALRAWVQESEMSPLSRADVERVISDAAGQDLSWFFAPAFDAHQTFDFAVTQASTESRPDCGGAPCFVTRVTAERLGTAQFTGSARAPAGPYESGRSLQLRVTFADQQRITAWWDGRSSAKTWEFESAAPTVAVVLDPDRTLLLDENFLNNAVKLPGTTNVPVAKWVARWLVWLQDATLTYTL